MYEIFTDQNAGTYVSAFANMESQAKGSRHVVVRLSPEEGSWEWLNRLHHDLEGALRAFRYLADKARQSYDADDQRSAKVLESIARHLQTVETLKTSLFDQVLPLDKGGPS